MSASCFQAGLINRQHHCLVVKSMAVALILQLYSQLIKTRIFFLYSLSCIIPHIFRKHFKQAFRCIFLLLFTQKIKQIDSEYFPLLYAKLATTLLSASQARNASRRLSKCVHVTERRISFIPVDCHYSIGNTIFRFASTIADVCLLQLFFVFSRKPYKLVQCCPAWSLFHGDHHVTYLAARLA